MSKKAKRSPEPTPTKPVDTSPHIPQPAKLDWSLTIRQRTDYTDKQRALIDLLLAKGTNVVFVKGPAGTAKTYLSIYCGLMLLNQRRVGRLRFVRTIVESASKSLGTLPGEAEEKLSPYLIPLMEKLDELLPPNEVKRLLADKHVVSTPVNYLRGASLNGEVIVLEEAQNYTLKELITALTRLGRFSRIIVVGDPGQSDLNGASGFAPLFEWFDQQRYRDHGIHCVAFERADIVRSGILGVLVDAFEEYRAAHAAPKVT